MHIKKLIAIVTSCSFIYSGILVPAIEGAMSAPVVSGAQFREVLGQLVIPTTVGRITDGKYFGSGKVVVNIQDLHCHPEVQKNISRIIGELDGKYHLKTVYLEGGYGDIDTSWLGKIKDAGLKKETAESLVDAGLLTGTEYYAVMNSRPALLKGIEDEAMHRGNIMRLGKMLERKGKYEAGVKALDKDLAFMKAKYFTSRNRKFNDIIERYRAGKIPADKYYRLLGKYVEKINADPYTYNNIFNIDLKNYPNMTGYLELLETGKHLPYKRISKQLQGFVGVLKQKLPYSAYNCLLEKTDNFSKLDKLYAGLSRLCKEYDLDLSRNFPDLAKFFAYIDKGQEMNPVQLIKEEKRLIEEIRIGLSQDISELEVSFVADFYGYFKDYLFNRLAADDYRYFSERFEKFRQTWAKYTYVNRLSGLEPEFAFLDEYYRVNAERNNVFLGKLIGDFANASPVEVSKDLDENIKATVKSLDNAPEILVVVTGGFHTEGLQELLSERRVSYLSITPNVTEDTKTASLVYEQFAKQQAKIFANQAEGPTSFLNVREVSRTARLEIKETIKSYVNVDFRHSDALGLAIASCQPGGEKLRAVAYALIRKLGRGNMVKATAELNALMHQVGIEGTIERDGDSIRVTVDGRAITLDEEVKAAPGERWGIIQKITATLPLVKGPAEQAADGCLKLYRMVEGTIDPVSFGALMNALVGDFGAWLGNNNIAVGDGLSYALASDPVLLQKVSQLLPAEEVAKMPATLQRALVDRALADESLKDDASQNALFNGLLRVPAVRTVIRSLDLKEIKARSAAAAEQEYRESLDMKEFAKKHEGGTPADGMIRGVALSVLAGINLGRFVAPRFSASLNKRFHAWWNNLFWANTGRMMDLSTTGAGQPNLATMSLAEAKQQIDFSSMGIEEIRPIIESRVDGLDGSIARGVSDEEAQAVYAKDPEFAMEHGIKRIQDEKGQNSARYIGSGYAHAYQKHKDEFEPLGGFDKCLNNDLAGKGLFIMSQDNFIEISRNLPDSHLFTILVTRANGDPISYYTATDAPPVEKKSIFSTMEDLALNLALPSYKPQDGASEILIAVEEGYQSTTVLRYALEHGVCRIAMENMPLHEFRARVQNCDRMTTRKSVQNQLSQIKQASGEFAVDLSRLHVQAEAEQFEEILKLDKKIIDDRIAQARGLILEIDASLRDGVDYHSEESASSARAAALGKKIVADFKKEFAAPFETLFAWIAVSRQAQNLPKSYRILREIGYATLSMTGGLGGSRSFLQLLGDGSINMNLLQSRYLALREKTGTAGLVLFLHKFPDFFGMRDGRPVMSNQEFYRYTKSIDVDRLAQATEYVGHIGANEIAEAASLRQLLVYFVLAGITMKGFIAAEDPQFHNLNDGDAVRRSFAAVMGAIDGRESVLGKLTVLLQKAGVTVELIYGSTPNKVKEIVIEEDTFAVYADEIAQALFDLVDECRIMRVDSGKTAAIEEAVKGLTCIRGKGIECRLMPRTFDKLGIGKITGDCTKPGEVNFDKYLEWFSDKDYELFEVYDNTDNVKKFVMRIHVLKTWRRRGSEPVLVIDAHEPIPDEALGDSQFRKGILFAQAMQAIAGFARKQGIKEIFANKISNRQWIRDMYDSVTDYEEIDSSDFYIGDEFEYQSSGSALSRVRIDALNPLMQWRLNIALQRERALAALRSLVTDPETSISHLNKYLDSVVWSGEDQSVNAIAQASIPSSVLRKMLYEEAARYLIDLREELFAGLQKNRGTIENYDFSALSGNTRTEFLGLWRDLLLAREHGLEDNNLIARLSALKGISNGEQQRYWDNTYERVPEDLLAGLSNLILVSGAEAGMRYARGLLYLLMDNDNDNAWQNIPVQQIIPLLKKFNDLALPGFDPVLLGRLEKGSIKNEKIGESEVRMVFRMHALAIASSLGMSNSPYLLRCRKDKREGIWDRGTVADLQYYGLVALNGKQDRITLKWLPKELQKQMSLNALEETTTPSITAERLNGTFGWLIRHIVLFAALPVHEIAHLGVARIFGLPVSKAESSLFGSVSIDYRGASPVRKAIVYAAGLAANLALGLAGIASLAALPVMAMPVLGYAVEFVAATNIALFISDGILSLVNRRGDLWDARQLLLPERPVAGSMNLGKTNADKRAEKIRAGRAGRQAEQAQGPYEPRLDNSDGGGKNGGGSISGSRRDSLSFRFSTILKWLALGVLTISIAAGTSASIRQAIPLSLSNGAVQSVSPMLSASPAASPDRAPAVSPAFASGESAAAGSESPDIPGIAYSENLEAALRQRPFLGDISRERLEGSIQLSNSEAYRGLVEEAYRYVDSLDIAQGAERFSILFLEPGKDAALVDQAGHALAVPELNLIVVSENNFKDFANKKELIRALVYMIGHERLHLQLGDMSSLEQEVLTYKLTYQLAVLIGDTPITVEAQRLVYEGLDRLVNGDGGAYRAMVCAALGVGDFKDVYYDGNNGITVSIPKQTAYIRLVSGNGKSFIVGINTRTGTVLPCKGDMPANDFNEGPEATMRKTYTWVSRYCGWFFRIFFGLDLSGEWWKDEARCRPAIQFARRFAAPLLEARAFQAPIRVLFEGGDAKEEIRGIIGAHDNGLDEATIKNRFLSPAVRVYSAVYRAIVSWSLCGITMPVRLAHAVAAMAAGGAQVKAHYRHNRRLSEQDRTHGQVLPLIDRGIKTADSSIAGTAVRKGQIVPGISMDSYSTRDEIEGVSGKYLNPEQKRHFRIKGASIDTPGSPDVLHLFEYLLQSDAFNNAAARVSFKPDFAGAEVMIIGPGRTAAEIERFIELYPGVKSIHIVDSSDNFLAGGVGLEQLKGRYGDGPANLPQIHIHRVNALAMPQNLAGKMDAVIDIGVFDPEYFTPAQLNQAAREVTKVLKRGGMHFSFAHHVNYGSLDSAMPEIKQHISDLELRMKTLSNAEMDDQKLTGAAPRANEREKAPALTTRNEAGYTAALLNGIGKIFNLFRLANEQFRIMGNGKKFAAEAHGAANAARREAILKMHVGAWLSLAATIAVSIAMPAALHHWMLAIPAFVLGGLVWFAGNLAAHMVYDRDKTPGSFNGKPLAFVLDSEVTGDQLRELETSGYMPVKVAAATKDELKRTGRRLVNFGFGQLDYWAAADAGGRVTLHVVVNEGEDFGIKAGRIVMQITGTSQSRGDGRTLKALFGRAAGTVNPRQAVIFGMLPAGMAAVAPVMVAPMGAIGCGIGALRNVERARRESNHIEGAVEITLSANRIKAIRKAERLEDSFVITEAGMADAVGRLGEPAVRTLLAEMRGKGGRVYMKYTGNDAAALERLLKTYSMDGIQVTDSNLRLTAIEAANPGLVVAQAGAADNMAYREITVNKAGVTENGTTVSIDGFPAGKAAVYRITMEDGAAGLEKVLGKIPAGSIVVFEAENLKREGSRLTRDFTRLELFGLNLMDMIKSDPRTVESEREFVYNLDLGEVTEGTDKSVAALLDGTVTGEEKKDPALGAIAYHYMTELKDEKGEVREAFAGALKQRIAGRQALARRAKTVGRSGLEVGLSDRELERAYCETLAQKEGGAADRGVMDNFSASADIVTQAEMQGKLKSEITKRKGRGDPESAATVLALIESFAERKSRVVVRREDNKATNVRSLRRILEAA